MQDELVRRCQGNPSYSLRAFARSLGYDFSALSKILRGDRPAGKKVIQSLGSKLGLGPEELQLYIQPLSRRSSSGVLQSVSQYELIAVDSFRVISEWYHFAILELMRVKGFDPSVSWISRSLGITQVEARSALERLQRVGFIKKNTDGQWMDITSGKTTTVGSVPSVAARKNLQKQILEKALAALQEIPIEERDQSTVTFAMDESLLKEASDDLREFRRNLTSKLSRRKKPTRVYHLSISLYPVSKSCLISKSERKKS